MRGKVEIRGISLSSVGITPAYAGKRSPRTRLTVPHKDHPRLCGEKCPAVLIIVCNQGSPPPMRGKATKGTAAGYTKRITPAYAGKSKSSTVPHIRSKDHPRLCGEKAVQKLEELFTIGSPPPMRGKVYFMFGMSLVIRITPAYAGKSE